MTTLRRTTLVFIWLACIAPALAQPPRTELEIISAYIGFPTRPSLRQNFMSDHLYKDGFWTPVFVDVKCHRDYEGNAYLVVEASDCDELPGRYTVAVPKLQAGQNEIVIGYARSGGRNDNIVVKVVNDRGRDLAPEAVQPGHGLEPAQFLVLSIGATLDGAPLPGLPSADEQATQVGRMQQGRLLLGNALSLKNMPTNWFAYQTCDLVILCTGNREFMTELVSEREGRKAALAEWVRRGGRIIVSVGRNQDLLAGAGELREMLPMLPIGTDDRDVERIIWKDGAANDEPLGKLALAKLSPRTDRNTETLVDGPNGMPLVLRSSFGSGRVSMVAFDVEDKPLEKWKGRESFWRELVNRSGPRVPSDTFHAGNMGFNRFGNQQTEDQDLTNLVQSMENFPGVPVISFGWVALFILLYILIVGPLDYLFLKKVVKRLEFTWITFPTIVLLVSAAAYYAAYALKGSDLRINKYDMVDIDLVARQVSGRTWFTLFSPRIQNYNVGVEPAVPEWASPPDEQMPDVLVGWAGASRQTRQSLFRRSYDYLPKATGMVGVPIQVWSTKGFQGHWFSPPDPNRPLIESSLRRPPAGKGLIGTVTLHLPDTLENAFLVESGGQREATVRSLGAIQPNVPKTVSAQESRQFGKWIANPFSTGDAGEQVTPVNANAWFPINMTFHDLRSAHQGATQNASLRDLDLSWRLNGSSGDVAILVGTLPRLEATGEEVTSNKANPSQLWLGAFPERGKQRPRVDGKMRQDTFVRIILPISSASSP